MSRYRRIAIALLFGGIAPIIPASTYAGGGVAPSAGRGGGGPAAAISVNVDHTAIPHKNIDFLDFYPRSVTVHQGDTVDFHWVESNSNNFHTVTFVPAGVGLTQQALARVLPGGGAPIPDKDDPGPSVALSLNPLQKPCGNSPYFPHSAPCNYDGHSVVNSGVLFANTVAERGKFRPTPPLHFAVTMNVAPGTYHYFCLVHGPGMSGTVTVAPAAGAVTTRAQAAQSSAAQFQAEKAELAGVLARTPAPAAQTQGGHSTWTITAGLPTSPTSKLETDVFSAPNLSIKAGDTVVWQPRGFHTVTFPRFAGIPAIGISCETPGGPDRPFTGSLVGCDLEAPIERGAFPSGPPGAPYTGGFADSGIMVIPKPHAWSMSFPSAGTYRYQCLIHFGMYGTITVNR